MTWGSAAGAAVFFVDAVALAPAFVAPAVAPFVAAALPVVVLVTFAVARREVRAGAGGTASGSRASACPLGDESWLSTRKRVHALWNGAGVLASPKP